MSFGKVGPFSPESSHFEQDSTCGKDKFENYFFCFEVKDKDIPWDIQEDW